MDIVGLIRASFACRCPRCGIGGLYKSTFDLRLHDHCPHCGLTLADNDNGDGPAVFLIFILGFLLVPLAVMFDLAFNPPLWLTGFIGGVVVLVLTVAMLKPTKTLVLYLQYKYRPGNWSS